MKATTLKPRKLSSNHKAVAPVIATLLMVAIAVVGGTLIFVFSQGFFSSSQISGTPTIEAVKILGYDARDGTTLTAHDEQPMLADSAGVQNGQKEADERVAIYLKNDSVQTVSIAELRFAGSVYQYNSTSPLDTWSGSSPASGAYSVMTNTPDTLLTASAAEIQPGQIVTVVIDLDENIKIGRDTQFKMTTANGAVFVGTVNIGQQSG